MRGTVMDIVVRGHNLRDTILSQDLESILTRHDPWHPKETIGRLESAFRSAVYRGVYEAFELEKECENWGREH